MRKPKSDYSIQTVTNALRLLEAFRDEEEIGVADLSRRLSLHKNNVFRLLATLEEQGYIEQNQVTERYRLGLCSLELGHSFARGRSLRGRVRPTLEGLAESTGEAAHLAMLDEFEVVHVDGARTDRLVLCSLRVGCRLPSHCTALGKALLACGPETEWEHFDRTIAAGAGLVQRTPETITDRAKFVEELRAVLAHGHALDVGECEPGLGCVAAPIRDTEGRVVAALSISAPLFRAPIERLQGELLAEVTAASSDLSRQLGYLG